MAGELMVYNSNNRQVVTRRTARKARKAVKRLFRKSKGVKRNVNSTVGQAYGIAGFGRRQPFPTHKNIVLTYVMSTNLNSSSGLTVYGTEKSFNLNSLYSPETSGGHQYYYFDQICASGQIYGRYKVNAVRVRVTFTGVRGGDSADDQENCYGAILLNNISTSDSIAGKSTYLANELPQVKLVQLSSSGDRPAVIDFYVPMHKLFGWNKSAYRNDMNNTTAAYNGNPASIPTMRLAIAALSAPTTVCTAYAKVEMIAYATLYARNIVSGS